jgi:hypothetical protein
MRLVSLVACLNAFFYKNVVAFIKLSLLTFVNVIEEHHTIAGINQTTLLQFMNIWVVLRNIMYTYIPLNV